MLNVANCKGKEKGIKWHRFARWKDNQGLENDSFQVPWECHMQEKKYWRIWQKRPKRKYYKQLRKKFDAKVIGGNLNTGLNSWAVVVIRYSVVFFDWTRLEIQKIERKTWILMALHKALHSKSNVGEDILI